MSSIWQYVNTKEVTKSFSVIIELLEYFGYDINEPRIKIKIKDMNNIRRLAINKYTSERLRKEYGYLPPEWVWNMLT